MYQYTMAQFDPSQVSVGAAEAEWRPIRTRVVSAESEADACDMMGDTGNQTYWEVIDSDDPDVLKRIAR